MTALDFPSGCMAFAPPPRCLLPQRVPPGSQWMGPQGLVTVQRAFAEQNGLQIRGLTIGA